MAPSIQAAEAGSGMRHIPGIAGSRSPASGVAVGVALSFAVLGDSIAFGQGATQRAHTAGARLAADLAAHGIAADLRVFAVPGARSTGLAAQVRSARQWPPQL